MIGPRRDMLDFLCFHHWSRITWCVSCRRVNRIINEHDPRLTQNTRSQQHRRLTDATAGEESDARCSSHRPPRMVLTLPARREGYRKHRTYQTSQRTHRLASVSSVQILRPIIVGHRYHRSLLRTDFVPTSLRFDNLRFNLFREVVICSLIQGD